MLSILYVRQQNTKEGSKIQLKILPQNEKWKNYIFINFSVQEVQYQSTKNSRKKKQKSYQRNKTRKPLRTEKQAIHIND